MNDIAIRLSNLTKRFRLYSDNVTGPIKDILRIWPKGPGFETYYQELTVIKNLSLEVRKGEIVGIVGPNGAGKTTLLQIIAGILEKDGGTIEVDGRLTSLLALGVAVHPEFSGRENIYHNGLLYGMTIKEIEEKTPWIIEFSELEEVIERPFRTYSSGMQARLLFSISMSIDPDILIVDEALSTGDSRFVEKCKKRIEEISANGATILFVSHSLTLVQQFCNRALFMVEGRVEAEGSPVDVIRAYSDWVHKIDSEKDTVDKDSQMLSVDGSGDIVIEDAILRNGEGEITKSFYSGEDMMLDLKYACQKPGPYSTLVFVGIVRSSDGVSVAEVSSKRYLKEGKSGPLETLLFLEGKGKITVRFSPILLLNNNYNFTILLVSNNKTVCHYKNVSPFFVARRVHSIDRSWVFMHPATFEVKRTDVGTRSK